MQTGLHTVAWGLQRMGIVFGILVFGAVFAYVMLVLVLVVAKPLPRSGSRSRHRCRVRPRGNRFPRDLGLFQFTA
jgi:uncharacterized membrane protein